MAAVVNPTSQVLHRKPIGGYAARNGPAQTSQSIASQQQHEPQQYNAPTVAAQHAMNGAQGQIQQSHSQNYVSNNSMTHQYSTLQQHHQNQSRRTLSNATSSTSSTGNANGLQRVSTASASAYGNGIRRSTSSRSNGSASPTSYVALMRKQKATVWCDRAQPQDPRLAAAQRQAKMRAVKEVAGGQNYNPSTRISTSSAGITGGVRSKIRHHGAPKAKDYNSGNLSGAGVPMRLSATEVDEGDSDDDPVVRNQQRASSSRSSMGSTNNYGFSTSHRPHGNGTTPPNAISPVESMGDLAEEETPMPGQHAGQSDYFAQAGGTGGSGSSGEVERNFGGVAGLPQSRERLDSEHVTSDELRRRGSVDDRTMTMSAGRLFVANPDLSD